MNAIRIAVTLNGAPQTVAPGTTLAALMAATGQPPQAMSTAVNGDFVARAARETCVLREGDAVFTFQPITGG